jgi:peptidyl-prolyl cis-trans isomerase SurA
VSGRSKNIVRKLLVVLLLGLAAAPAAADSSPNAGKKIHLEKVVAIVNDSIILQSELDARLQPVMQEAQQIPDENERKRRIAKLTGQVLDDMVNEELIVQAAEAGKIEVDSSEVQAALDEIKQQNNLDDAGLQQALVQQGYSLQNYKADLRRQLLRFRAINTIVAPKVNITDEDIRARYDQMQRRSEQVSAVRISDILVKLPDHPTEQQINDAKAKASAALDRVKGGEDFTTVAKDVSDDDSTKASGGELGWFERGSVNPDWEGIVFAMDKDEVRGPINGPQGLYVLKVTDVKKSDLKPYAEMKEQLSRELRRREIDKQTATWIEELRKKAYIDIKLQ